MHDFRRSASKRQTRLGIPESSIMKAGGWKTRAMFDRYRIESLSDQQLVAQKYEAEELRRKQQQLANSPTSAPLDASVLEKQKVTVQ